MDVLELQKTKAEIQRLRKVASSLSETDSIRKAVLERADKLEKEINKK